jgi:hypothetical protein
MKYTNEKGISLIYIILIVIILVIAFTIIKSNNSKDDISDEEILRTVSSVATDLQKAKASLKETLQKNVTTEETMKYLASSNLIDESNNILNTNLQDLRLLSNGLITYKGEKKGQILLTDYYEQKQIKTIWTQDSTVDNNLVTIQVNDGKFLNIQEDNSYKVWKYEFTAYDENTHGRFSYWENESGDIISTEKTLYESASIDRVYTAVYDSEKTVEPGNRITMAFEKVDNSIVGSIEGMHYAEDITEKVYSVETGKYENYDIKGSILERVGIIFTLNEEKGTSEDFGCTTQGDDVGYTTIFDRTNENYNTLVSYNYENSGIIMISQGINITLDAIKALNPKSGDVIYMKPFMLFSVDGTGYYIDGDLTYELTY